MRKKIMSIILIFLVSFNKIEGEENKLLYTEMNTIDVVQASEETILVNVTNRTKFVLRYDNKLFSVTNTECNNDNCYIEIKASKSAVGKTNLEIVDKKTGKMLSNIVVNIIEKPIEINEKQRKVLSVDEKFANELVKLNNKFNVYSDNDFEKLSTTEMSIYIEELEIIKEELYPETPQFTTFGSYDAHDDLAGDILSTTDSKTSGYAHGHAGIHGLKYRTTVEGIDSKQGIKVLKNNLSYWEGKKGKAWRYEVKGASRTKFVNAAKWAESKANNDKIYYCLVKMPWDSECYQCATFVTAAWKNTGVTIKYLAYVNTNGREQYTEANKPSHFRMSSQLKKVKSY